MFEGADYPKSLDEDQFNLWLEEGRQSKIPYEYMLVVWDEFEKSYSPAYLENRERISEYHLYGTSVDQESVVAGYALYSEARLSPSLFNK